MWGSRYQGSRPLRGSSKRVQSLAGAQELAVLGVGVAQVRTGLSKSERSCYQLVVTSLPLMLIAGLLGPASGDAADAPDAGAAEPGINFHESLTKREREPLSARFDEALEQACEPPPCVSKCKEDESILSLTRRRDDRDYALSWRLRDPRLDEPSVLETSCELCSLAEVESQIAADLSSMCTRLSSLEGAPGRLRVTSDPIGASVRVDGRRVGKTPWSGEVEAGEHEVVVSMRGHEDESRTLTLVSGVEESVDFTLMSELPEGPVQKPRPQWPAWTGIGAGVALAIAGTALIALQGKDYRGDYEGENIDINQSCRYVYDTRGLGIGLATVGAAAFGAGVGLMVWSQRGQFSASVGVRGRF